MNLKPGILLGIVWSATSIANAQVIQTEDRFSRGKYNDQGETAQGNDNYLVGNGGISISNVTYRNYFIFNLSSLSPEAVIFSAELLLYNPSQQLPLYLDGYQSNDVTEDYTLFSLDRTSLTQLKDFSGSLIDTYADLADGSVYGSTTVSTASNGQYVSIQMNTDFINYLQSNIGQEIAIGGAITTLDSNPQTGEYVFGGTDVSRAPYSTTILVLNGVPVPEPSAALLGLGAAAGMLMRRRR